MHRSVLRHVSVVLAATGTAVAIYALGRHGLGIEIEPAQVESEQVTLGSVLVVSSISSALGWALLSALEGRHPRGRMLWTRIAVTFTVVSLLGPLTAPDLTAGGRALLVVLHLAVGSVTIRMLLRMRTPRRDQVVSSA